MSLPRVPERIFGWILKEYCLVLKLTKCISDGPFASRFQRYKDEQASKLHGGSKSAHRQVQWLRRDSGEWRSSSFWSRGSSEEEVIETKFYPGRDHLEISSWWRSPEDFILVENTSKSYTAGDHTKALKLTEIHRSALSKGGLMFGSQNNLSYLSSAAATNKDSTSSSTLKPGRIGLEFIA